MFIQEKNVVGKDIKFKEPINSDLIINNDFNKNIDIKLKKVEKIINDKIKKNNKEIPKKLNIKIV